MKIQGYFQKLCSQLLFGCLIHEGLGSFHTGKEVGKIFFVFDSGTIVTIVKFSGESSSTDFLGEGLAIKRCWESIIFGMSKVFNWSNIVSAMGFFLLEILFVLIGLLVLITTFLGMMWLLRFSGISRLFGSFLSLWLWCSGLSWGSIGAFC
jgi:hypothetical protein